MDEKLRERAVEQKGCDIKVVLNQNRYNSILVNGVEMKQGVRSVTVSGSADGLPTVMLEILPKSVEVTCMDATLFHKLAQLPAALTEEQRKILAQAQG